MMLPLLTRNFFIERRKVLRIHMRQGYHIAFQFAATVLHFHDMTFQVYLAGFVSSDRTHHGDSSILPQIPVDFQLGTAVVIACRDDNLHSGTGFMKFHQRIRVQPLGGCRRSAIMKHVARHDQHVGLFCGYPVAQLPQKVLLFFAAVVFKQLLPQVPVTSM